MAARRPTRPIARAERTCRRCDTIIIRAGEPNRPLLYCEAHRPQTPPRSNHRTACKDCGESFESLGLKVGTNRLRCHACAGLRQKSYARNYNSKSATPEQYLAQQSIYKARRRGDLLRPSYCQRCGTDCKPHAHHFAGYKGRNAFKVIWLCTKCHAAEHAGKPRGPYRQEVA